MNNTLSTEVDLDTGLVIADGTRQLISEPQRQAMEWLMGGGSVTEAAQYAGVSRSTVSRWMNEDTAFHALFEHWKQQVHTTNQARLVALSELALDTVVEAVKEKRNVQAALTVLKSLGLLK